MKIASKVFIILLITVLVPGLSLFIASRVEANSSNIIVSPANMQGWFFLKETGTTGTGQMVLGPGTPPLGAGSAQLTVQNTSDGMALARAGWNGIHLDQITKLEYSTYRTSGASPLAISLQFNIDNDVTDGDNSWKGRLVFEPYYTETVLTGEWQTWDPMTQGKWWGTRSPIKDTCPIYNPCTWDEVLNAFPNAGIHNIFGAILFKAGSGWDGFDGNVDAFTIGIDSVETTYNFEPVLNVLIDIKPGSFPNSINPRSRGVIPVAILTTNTFDAADVDPDTVLFGKTGTEASPLHYALEDVDSDGDMDLILHFSTQDTGIECGDTTASLTGETINGEVIQGSDSIKTAGCK